MITIGTVVEGQGEVQALPVLLRRLATHLRPDVDLVVPQPFRVPRGRLVKREHLVPAVRVASRRVTRGGVLVLADADDDCPVSLAAQLRSGLSGTVECPVAVVLAQREYEAWFLASLPSLGAHRDVSIGATAPGGVESVRGAKGALAAAMPGVASRETRHQAAFSQLMDLEQASVCTSFRKLVRDVESLLDG